MTTIDVDALAQEIRRVDGNHTMGAGHLAEAIAAYLSAAKSEPVAVKALEEQEINAIVARLTYMVNGDMGRDWRTGKEFVLHNKGDAVPALRDALRVICSFRSALASEPANG